MIIIIGSAIAQADKLAELLALSLEHVARSRTETGCTAHAVHRDVENPLRLVFVEEWTGSEAVAAHFALPASRAFIKAASALTTEPPKMSIYSATVMGLP